MVDDPYLHSNNPGCSNGNVFLLLLSSSSCLLELVLVSWGWHKYCRFNALDAICDWHPITLARVISPDSLSCWQWLRILLLMLFLIMTFVLPLFFIFVHLRSWTTHPVSAVWLALVITTDFSENHLSRFLAFRCAHPIECTLRSINLFHFFISSNLSSLWCALQISSVNHMISYHMIDRRNIIFVLIDVAANE